MMFVRSLLLSSSKQQHFTSSREQSRFVHSEHLNDQQGTCAKTLIWSSSFLNLLGFGSRRAVEFGIEEFCQILDWLFNVALHF